MFWRRLQGWIHGVSPRAVTPYPCGSYANTYKGFELNTDGDIKKLSSVRKSIAKTTYGAQNNKDEELYESPAVQE